jgi:uncharacterized protein YodC (DUF2158 family)
VTWSCGAVVPLTWGGPKVTVTDPSLELLSTFATE